MLQKSVLLSICFIWFQLLSLCLSQLNWRALWHSEFSLLRFLYSVLKSFLNFLFLTKQIDWIFKISNCKAYSPVLKSSPWLFCTVSSFSISFLTCGHQNCFQYSRTIFTSIMCKDKNSSYSLSLITLLFIHLKITLALFCHRTAQEAQVKFIFHNDSEILFNSSPCCWYGLHSLFLEILAYIKAHFVCMGPAY